MEYCCLPSGLVLLPYTLLSLMPWKPKPSRSLQSPAMKPSRRGYDFPIADRSVVYLASSTSFLFLHPLSSPWFVSTINPLLVKLSKSRITAHLHSFAPLFFFLSVEPTSTFPSISFLPPNLQDSCSPPSQIILHPKP